VTLADYSCSNTFREQRPNPFDVADFIGPKQNESSSGSYRYTNSLQTPPASVHHDSRSDSDEFRARRSCSNGAQNISADSEINANHMQSHPPGLKTPESTQQDRYVQAPGNTEATGTIDDSHGSPQNNRHDQRPCRKRSIRNLSAEIDEGPKRQKDDSHQKEKRKAPKVAAAYRSVSFLVSTDCFLRSDPK
jgi:hypothetical protein